MHAKYVRVWLVGGLAALALAIPMALAGLGASAPMLALGVGYLSLALVLGIIPAFARRDWPTPLFAVAALALAALALPFLRAERAYAALLGASLLVGAAQPAALLFASRWSAPHEKGPPTDRPALAALALALVAIGAAGLALIALPRGLPNAAFALLLAGAAPLAAFGTLLFLLPRQANAPFPAATLAWAAVAFATLASAGLAAAFAFPFTMDGRTPLAALATALGLGVVTLLRAPQRPRLLGAGLALSILATLALLLATIEPALLPLAFHAFLVLDLVLLGGALAAAAPILLPGRARGERWMRWAPAFLIAALFLYTPALQIGRSVVPATIVGAIGIVILASGLARLARAS